MSCFEKLVEYCINKFENKPCFQKAKKIWKESTRLDSAFYFFDLEQSCLLIALLGALVSFVKICWIYYLVYSSDTRSLFPDPKWIYVTFKGIKYYVCNHYTHHQFHVGRYLIKILNSTLLFFGVKWSYVAFLYYWIYISLFTWAMSNFYAVFNNFVFSEVFLFTIPKFMLQCYFILIVISLIWKIGEKPNSEVQENEEPGVELVE